MDVAASERLSLSERLSTISLRFSTRVCTREEKKVIFIDEIPWLDTPRSGFLSALEYFWNSFASARKDVLLIICGSATSWIINKVLKNHGGLHNRVTYRIHLQPFTLYECEQYAKYLGMRASHYDLIEYYMILGGVAFYFGQIATIRLSEPHGQERQHHQYLRDEVFQRRIHHNERLCDVTQQ